MIFAMYFLYFVGQTEYFKMLKQQAIHVATFNQLGIAVCFPKQEIDVTLPL